MAKRHFTKFQQLFLNEMKRLLKAIYQERKKTGLELDRDLIPKMPLRVTQKQLNNIKNIKPKDLRTGTQFIDKTTGQILSYDEAKTNASNAITPKPLNNYNTYHLDFFREQCQRWNENFQFTMESWLNRLIRDFGEQKVNEMIGEGIANGMIITKEIVYEEDKRNEFMSQMMDYLNMDEEYKADLLSAVEFEAGWGVVE